jgi:hypothetical protein
MKFVAAAFVVTWSVLLGYFIHVQRLMRRTRALLDGVTAAGRR